LRASDCREGESPIRQFRGEDADGFGSDAVNLRQLRRGHTGQLLVPEVTVVRERTSRDCAESHGELGITGRVRM
jgi:hypothetical protein